jgi:hypothetical protein
MSAERIWANSAAAGLLLLAALLAESTLRFGVPVAWDGVTLISQECGGQGCQSLAGWPPPDWVIVRYFFRFHPAASAAKQDAERMLQYLKTGISQSAYRRIDLPVVDTIWENIPEPDRHVFRDPGDRPKITVYEKVRP